MGRTRIDFILESVCAEYAIFEGNAVIETDGARMLDPRSSTHPIVAEETERIPVVRDRLMHR